MSDEINSDKEFYIGCAATDIVMCFLLKDIGTGLAKDNGDEPYFLPSNEFYWRGEAADDIRKAKKAKWAPPEFRESFRVDVMDQVNRLARVLPDVAAAGLINRNKWGKIFKDFFGLVKEMQALPVVN